MKTIYVLGSLNMDLAIETASLPKKGQTIAGDHFSTCPGGKGLNQAIAASKLGASVKMLGAVGNDIFGEKMVKTLKDNGVDTNHIKKLDDISSGIAIIILQNGDNRIILDLGANLKLKESDVDEFLKDASEDDIFLTQLENNIEIIGYALKVAKNKKMLTVVNPAPFNIEITKHTQYIDVLTPNSGELEDLLQNRPISKIGIPCIIETRGKDGYRLYKNSEIIENKAVEVKVVDTTGAGDAFNGALCYKLALGNKLDKNILDFACLAASLSTTRKGSSVSSLTKKEMDEYMKGGSING